MPKSSAICVDANVVIQFVTGPQSSPVVDLWSGWTEQASQLVAPHLLRYEVTNALHRLQRAGEIGAEDATAAMRAVIRLPIRLHTDDDIHIQAMEFSTRFNLPAAYDAHYLALADHLDAAFWTADKRLANTVGSALPWVHLVGE